MNARRRSRRPRPTPQRSPPLRSCRSGPAAASTALTYGATAGGKNTRPDLPNVVTGADTKCLNFLQQLMRPSAELRGR